MKRLHVHVAVKDIPQSIGFYSALFIEQGETACCYAKSEKSWIDDPAGIAWETFLAKARASLTATAPAKTRRARHMRSQARAPYRKQRPLKVRRLVANEGAR